MAEFSTDPNQPNVTGDTPPETATPTENPGASVAPTLDSSATPPTNPTPPVESAMDNLSSGPSSNVGSIPTPASDVVPSADSMQTAPVSAPASEVTTTPVSDTTDPTSSFSTQVPVNQPPAPQMQPNAVPPTPPSLTAEEVGPPWMRTDPNVRASQDTQGVGLTAAPDVVGTDAPWQNSGQQTPAQSAEEPKEGHFPVIIFVILVLGIIVAIGVFLFTQGNIGF